MRQTAELFSGDFEATFFDEKSVAPQVRPRVASPAEVEHVDQDLQVHQTG